MTKIVRLCATHNLSRTPGVLGWRTHRTLCRCVEGRIRDKTRHVCATRFTNRSAKDRTSAALVAWSAPEASSASARVRHSRQHSLILGI